MNQSSTAVVLLGDSSAPEVQPAVAFIKGLKNVTLGQASGVDDVRRFAAEERWFPDLVVALQTWPDQFSAGDAGQLLAIVPLARIVCVCGSWCDSEGRTHLNWPLAVRAPVPCAPGRISRELAAIRGETSPLPLTAGRGEVFAADFHFARPAAPEGTAIAVESPDRHWRKMVCDVFARGGAQIVELENPVVPGAIVWDADPWGRDRAHSLTSLRKRLPQATVVACIGFARDDLSGELLSAGADAVWFKLTPLQSLLEIVGRARG